MLRAGFTDVFDTGKLMRLMSPRLRPMVSGGRKVASGHAPIGPETEQAGWVEVGAGDVAERVDPGHRGETAGERDAEPADARIPDRGSERRAGSLDCLRDARLRPFWLDRFGVGFVS